VRNGQIYFSRPFSTEDELDTLKGRLKRSLGKWYYAIGVQVIGPSYPFNYRKKILSRVDPSASVVVDLGAGNHRISEDIVTLDGVDYEEVDIVADMTALPFRDDSIDCFCSRSVLEHVPELNHVIDEVRRCTAVGGLSLHHTPFLFPYHASPHDYQRFTHTGMSYLFRGWSILEQKNVGGPVSLLLIISTELLSTILSFGNSKLKPYLYLGLCLVVFPFKFFDVMFIGRKSMLGLCPTMLTIVRKP